MSQTTSDEHDMPDSTVGTNSNGGMNSNGEVNPNGAKKKGGEQNSISIYQRYFAGFTIRLGILRSAAIALSVLSFFTTWDGFKDTVFAGDGFRAGIASAAVQSILLAGIFFYLPIVNILLNVVPEKETVSEYIERPYKFTYERPKLKYRIFIIAIIAIFAGIWRLKPQNMFLSTYMVIVLLLVLGGSFISILILGLLPSFKAKWKSYFKVWTVTTVILTAMSISTMFSCVSISNSLYIKDYARDSDSAIEETIRKELLIVDGEIEWLVGQKNKTADNKKDSDDQEESMRFFLISRITQANDAIEAAAKTKAEQYFATVPKITHIAEAKMLYDLGDYEKEEHNIKDEEDKKGREVKYYSETGYAAIAPEFSDMKNKVDNWDSWCSQMDDLINQLNGESYLIYHNYYTTYEKLVDCYNGISKGLNSEGPKEELTLVKIKAIKKALIDLGNTIATDNQIEAWKEEKEKQGNRDFIKDSKNDTFLMGLDNLNQIRHKTEEELKDNSETENTIVIKRSHVIDEAIGMSVTLRTEIFNVVAQINSFIEVVYGDVDVLSVDEIVEVLGLSAPTESDIMILEKAAKQFRNTQGIMIKNALLSEKEGKAEEIGEEEIKKISDTLNNYVQLMQTKENISVLSSELNTSYIIQTEDELRGEEEIEEREKKGVWASICDFFILSDEETTKQDSDKETQSTPEEEPEPKTEEVSDTATEDVSEDSQSRAEKNKQKDDSETQKDVLEADLDSQGKYSYTHTVENVSVEEWREIRNNQLSQLKECVTALQFVKNSIDPSKSQSTEQSAIAEIDYLIHTYINATSLEKTYNLIFNSRENNILREGDEGDSSDSLNEGNNYRYFTYRGKAFLALGISVFMDFGSALIGVLMYFLDPKEMEKKLITYSLQIKKQAEKTWKPRKPDIP